MSPAGADLVLDVLVARPRTHVTRVFVARNPTLAAGCFVLLLMALSAIAAPLSTSTDPQKMNPSMRLRPPDDEHPFGTDHFGRDVFARTLYGDRISLRVGLIVALLALTTGTAIGLVSGYYRELDMVVMRIVDSLMAIPSIPLALALMALVRASVETVIVALVVPEIPRVVRVVRAQVLSLREQTMVEGARALPAYSSSISCPRWWRPSLSRAHISAPWLSWWSPTCPSSARAPRPTSRAGAISWPRVAPMCSSASGSSCSPASS